MSVAAREPGAIPSEIKELADGPFVANIAALKERQSFFNNLINSQVVVLATSIMLNETELTALQAAKLAETFENYQKELAAAFTQLNQPIPIEPPASARKTAKRR